MANNPSTRWFFNDWMLEPGLRLCSVSARGLWIDMLAIAATGPRPGYLVDADGKALSICELARRVGAKKGSVHRWLRELEKHGVFSRDGEGIIFNRRMAREASQKKGRKTPKRPDRERDCRQLELFDFRQPLACARDSGFRLRESTPVANPESVAAREVEKQEVTNPGARCARLGDAPPPPASSGFAPSCKRAADPPKSPALKAKIKAQLAAKHVRFLGARGRPGEAAAYLAQIDATGIPPPDIFEAIDRRMRREAWDDMHAWKLRHLDGGTGPPAPGSLAALLARQGWGHGPRPAA